MPRKLHTKIINGKEPYLISISAMFAIGIRQNFNCFLWLSPQSRVCVCVCLGLDKWILIGRARLPLACQRNRPVEVLSSAFITICLGIIIELALVYHGEKCVLHFALAQVCGMNANGPFEIRFNAKPHGFSNGVDVGSNQMKLAMPFSSDPNHLNLLNAHCMPHMHCSIYGKCTKIANTNNQQPNTPTDKQIGFVWTAMKMLIEMEKRSD